MAEVTVETGPQRYIRAATRDVTMSTTEVRSAGTGQATAAAMARSKPTLDPSSEPMTTRLGPRRTGYGLPCSKCKTYYGADLNACPVCQTKERVSPLVSTLPTIVAPAEELPDSALLEEERERFLLEFNAKVQAAQLEGDPGAGHDCNLQEHHNGSAAPAVVCQGCYDRIQERVDLMEAALHIDLKEASQIVYDAVWADPSDPNKTYQNAAQALLLDLRKRAGVKLVLGPLQPLPH
jgi:hypothetical protein